MSTYWSALKYRSVLGHGPSSCGALCRRLESVLCETALLVFFGTTNTDKHRPALSVLVYFVLPIPLPRHKQRFCWVARNSRKQISATISWAEYLTDFTKKKRGGGGGGEQNPDGQHLALLAVLNNLATTSSVPLSGTSKPQAASRGPSGQVAVLHVCNVNVTRLGPAPHGICHEQNKHGERRWIEKEDNNNNNNNNNNSGKQQRQGGRREDKVKEEGRAGGGKNDGGGGWGAKAKWKKTMNRRTNG